MSSRLMASLFIPYLVIAILGSVADNTYSSSPLGDDQLKNQMMAINVSEAKTVATQTQTGAESRENKIMAGMGFLTDATGTMFGFTKLLFKTLTLNYSWWSECKKSTDTNPGYNSVGNPLISGTNSCYIDANGVTSKDAPQAFMMVRYLLLILALPGIYIILFKSAELFARFISAVGSGIGALSGFIRGIV
tara:strand:- start:28 stop:600 length:573 start_codon:yes stop_codon:yes gene_type:complete